MPHSGIPSLSAVVLAAGRSVRMGEANKLLLPVDGRPMIRCSVEVYPATGIEDVIVVTGHDAPEIRRALTGLPVRFVHNPAYADGMAGSLRAGVRALPEWVDGFLVGLGDLPALQQDTIRSLIHVFRSTERPAIVRPVCHGRRGHPVLFDVVYRADFGSLVGDVGASPILRAHETHVVEVPVEDAGVVTDVDTPEAYRRWNGS